jgi:hypothetical protein
MPGTRNNGTNPLIVPTLDLDALLAEASLEPRPVKLMGKTYHVRRDLTGTQVTEYWKLVREGKDVDALAMIVTAPVMLNKILEKLPREHMLIVVREIMQAAGLVDMVGDVGEARAS